MAHPATISSGVVVRNTFLHVGEDEFIESRRRDRRPFSDPPSKDRRGPEVEPADLSWLRSEAPPPCAAPPRGGDCGEGGNEGGDEEPSGNASHQFCSPCTSRGASPERLSPFMTILAHKIEVPPATPERPVGFSLSLCDTFGSQPPRRMSDSAVCAGVTQATALPTAQSHVAPMAAASPVPRAYAGPLTPPPGSFPALPPFPFASASRAAGFAAFDSPVSSFSASPCHGATAMWDRNTPLSAATTMSPMAAWAAMDPRSQVSPLFPSPFAAPNTIAPPPSSPPNWHPHTLSAGCQSMQQDKDRANFPSAPGHVECGRRDLAAGTQRESRRRGGRARKDAGRFHTAPLAGGCALPGGVMQPHLQQPGVPAQARDGHQGEHASSRSERSEATGTPVQQRSLVLVQRPNPRPSDGSDSWPEPSRKADGKSALIGLGDCEPKHLGFHSSDETESTAGSGDTPISACGSPTRMTKLLGACTSVESVMQVAAIEAGQRDLLVQDVVDALQVAAQKVAGSAPAGVARLPAFAKLFSNLKGKANRGELWQASDNLKVLKALGKLEVQGPHAHWFIVHLEGALRSSQLANWNSQDLVFCLWALAKMVPEGAARGAGTDASRRLAHEVVSECISRVNTLKPQCLTMSIHAIAKLRLSGAAIDSFAGKCVQECANSRDLESFMPQSLANILWAAVQLSPGGRGKSWGGLADSQVWPLWQAVQGAALPRLRSFPAQELAMVANATSKLQQRATKGRSDQTPPGLGAKADAFLLEIGRVATARVGELSPQAISNIALALAKGDTLAKGATRDFLAAAADHSSHGMCDWEPQAISNFCCAIGRLCSDTRRVCNGEEQGSLPDAFSTFGDAVARETARRIQSFGLALEGRGQTAKQFGWVDVSGVLTAFGHGRFCSKPIFKLAFYVLSEAQQCVGELSMRVLLNMCLAASRLSAPPEYIEPLADAMADRMRLNHERLTLQDKRQWEEVKRFCKGTNVAAPRAPQTR